MKRTPKLHDINLKIFTKYITASKQENLVNLTQIIINVGIPYSCIIRVL
jgi:hypothetical protein